MKKFSRTIVPAALATLVGCGGGDDGFTKAKGTLTKEQAQTLASDISSSWENADLDSNSGLSAGAAPQTGFTMQNLQTALRGLSIEASPSTKAAGNPYRAAETSFGDCEPTIGGSAETDADKDGVPASYSLTFACNNIDFSALGDEGGDDEMGGGFTGKLSLNGTSAITDKDDTSKIAGFILVNDYTSKFSMDFGGQSATVDFKTKSNYDLSRSGATFTFIADDVSTISAKGGNESYSVKSGSNLNFTFTGTNAETPEAAGTATLTGFLGLQVVGTGENAKPESVVVQIASEGLKYDDTCENFFTEGKVTITDGSSNKITYNYGDADCDEAGITYNDEAITAL